MEVVVARGRRVNSHEYEAGSIPGVLQSRGACYRLQPHPPYKAKKELPTRSRVKEWPFLWVRTIFIDMIGNLHESCMNINNKRHISQEQALWLPSRFKRGSKPFKGLSLGSLDPPAPKSGVH